MGILKCLRRKLHSSWLLLFNLPVMSDSFATPGTVAHQAPLSMGFSRKEYWSVLLLPPPGELPHPGIKPASASPALQADSLPLIAQGSNLDSLE